ncbi:MAG: DUF362 domain-containing protein [Deltaproteobacteria bacterium]|nr:DUF362 domain-containing protein [Deltaproteobacteria bacterium]
MHRVMIHPADYNTCLEAVGLAFELFPLDVSGKKVLVKPNVLRASNAEEGIVTNPAVLAAVIHHLEKRNPASIVVGDNPGAFSYGANEASFRQAGLLEAAGAYYRNISTESLEVDFNPDYVDRLSVSRSVMETDVFISLPKFKTHGLTVITGAIKNSFGILPGAQKAALHRMAGNPKRFHELIVDVFRLRVPDLFIVDAVVGMEGNGPAGRDLRNINRILASDNAVALDATISRMMGLEPHKLGFMRKAKELGLGDFDSGAIELIGDLTVIPDFKLPPLGGEALHKNEAIQNFIRSRTLLRPKADPDLCNACQTCIEHCPVSALSMQDDLPVVDADTCITCFCCQEMCPEKAITLQ